MSGRKWMKQKDTGLIIDRINAQRKTLFNLLRDLIRIQSYSGQEKEIVEFIMKVMNHGRFDQVMIDKFGNVIGRIGDGMVKILYDAHIDTVAVTESENWIYPPFEGKMKNGKIYGRGAVDEKPAMAGYLIAAGVLKELNIPLPFTLYIVGSVMEEECDGYPLHHIISEEQIRPDYVLLGEPTDLRVFRGQRGRMEFEIETSGQSAHGAHNQKGINAIYKMMPLINEIEKRDKELPYIAPLGKGALTVSQIISEAPSLCSVPDYCRVHIDRRLTVEETQKTALAELRKLIDNIQPDARIKIPEYIGKSWTGYSFKQEAYFPTWITDENHALVNAAMSAAELCGGKTDRSDFWQFSTNGVATAGRLDIPTIGFAPGEEELAHTSHEELILEELLIATRFYAILPFILAQVEDK
jgi:putative selenium metabolism hydrolase